MKDNEIIKAFELCFAPDPKACSKCPYNEFGKLCKTKRNRDALDLINRQKEELERLTKENDELKNGFFQEHYKENEVQELLSVTEAWRKESLHNIDLEAEIERLEAEVDKQYEQAEADILANMADGGMSCHWCITKHKAEAIKDFAERLKELYTGEIITDDMHCSVAVIKANIDDLVKEMIGEQ